MSRQGKNWLLSLGLFVMLLLSGTGVINKGWGIAAQAVFDNLDDRQVEKSDFSGCSGVVVDVVDGDTIKVDIVGPLYSIETCRLIGVDTPETKHPRMPVQFFGPEATQFVKNMCEGKTVKLYLPSDGEIRGKYGRLLVYVELLNGNILNEMIVENGFGYSYTKYKHSKTGLYNKLQKDARSRKRGLWASVKFDDLPAWLRKSNPDILKQ